MQWLLIHVARGMSALYWYIYTCIIRQLLLCRTYRGSGGGKQGSNVEAATDHWWRDNNLHCTDLLLQTCKTLEGDHQQYYTEREWVTLPELPSDKQLFVQVI